MGGRRTRLLAAGAIAAALLALPQAWAPAHAANDVAEEETQDTLLSADEVIYDHDLGIVTARGNVRIQRGERVLNADSISYNQKEDTVDASGNVSLIEPTGEVLFSDYMKLENELKTGFIRNVRVIFADNSRLAANGARRFDENRSEMSKAVYSSCELCKEDPDKPPLWRIKAIRVIHNKAEQRIDYQDAFLEFFGVPVAYVPYFSHPDPSASRKSGFLAPLYGNSSYLGYNIRTPYYYVISPDKDVTITPLFTTDAGVQLAAEYRQRFRSGYMEFDGSGTYVDELDDTNEKTGDEEFRGHIRGNGNFSVNDVWNWGFDVFRSSDDTYLRRYDISDYDTLTSRAYLQGLRGRSYAAVNAYSFQGLDAFDDPGETPIILPLAEYTYVGEPGAHGGRYSFDASALVLHRTEGTDSRRISSKIAWELPYTSPAGDMYKLTASLRGDAYWVEDVVTDPTDPNSREDGFTGRLVPLLALEWRYPFVRSQGSTRQTVEPIVQAVWTPVGGNPDLIPNEDSQSFEFDDTNLFSLDRYPGLDRVEGSFRVNYGTKVGLYGEGGGYTTLLVGQTYRARADETFGNNTGLEDNFSDIVARLDIRPGRYLDLSERIRLDKDNYNLNRHEVTLDVGPTDYRFRLGYVSLSQDETTDEFDNREEIYLAGRVKVVDHWFLFGSYRRDLTDGGQSLSGEAGVRYLDECFDVIFTVGRRYTRDRDLEPSTNFNLRVRLIPLG